MKSQPVIGVFDSGVGGLTVLKSLSKALPGAKFIYVGDSARTPYGTKSAETIIGYSKQCVDFLLSKGAELIVIACNTASTAALEVLQQEYDVPMYGMVEPASHVAVSLRKGVNKPIAVVGTEGTINSRAYDHELISLDPTIEVISAACPLFVPVVEQGIFSGIIVEELLQMYLKQIKYNNPYAIILACTHYPLLSDAIEKYLGKEVAIVTSADAVSVELASLYPQAKSGEVSTTSISFFTTDNVERFNRLGSMILEPHTVFSEKISL